MHSYIKIIKIIFWLYIVYINKYLKQNKTKYDQRKNTKMGVQKYSSTILLCQRKVIMYKTGGWKWPSLEVVMVLVYINYDIIW